nr:MAG TPA: hypothetical protein [Caudoviricetes sp.]
MSIKRKNKNKEELVKYKTFDQLAYEILYDRLNDVIDIEVLLKMIITKISTGYSVFYIPIATLPLRSGYTILSKRDIFELRDNLICVFQLYDISMEYEDLMDVALYSKHVSIKFKSKI